MITITPHEFLALWQQTGKEPSIPEEFSNQQLNRSSWEQLCKYTSDMLFEATDLGPHWVNKVVSSQLAQRLQHAEPIVFAPKENKKHPWAYTIARTLEHLLSYNRVKKEGTLSLTDHIKDNLNCFRGHPDPVIKRGDVASLLLTLGYIKSNEQQESDAHFGFDLVANVLPSCTDEEKLKSLSIILDRNPSDHTLDFVLEQIKQQNLTIPKQNDLYGSLLFSAVSGVRKATASHHQQMIQLLTHTKFRDQKIRNLIINGNQRGNSPYPNMEQFISLLPEKELPGLLECVLWSPFNPKGLKPDQLPPSLKSFWVRKKIQESLKDHARSSSVFNKIKTIVFSSRMPEASIVKDPQSDPQPQTPPSRPRKKM